MNIRLLAASAIYVRAPFTRAYETVNDTVNTVFHVFQITRLIGRFDVAVLTKQLHTALAVVAIAILGIDQKHVASGAERPQPTGEASHA